MRRLVFLSLTTLGLMSCNPGEGKIAYVGANLWDGTGARAISNAVIIVADGRIEAAGSAEMVPVPRGATIEQVDGKWIIPGLIDAHGHTKRWMLSHFLRHGVTSVRDAGGDADSIYALRDAIASGSILGPRLYVAGAPVNATPTSSAIDEGVRTPVEARRAVGNRRLRNASLVMLSPRIHEDVYRAIMDEASALNLPVAAHLGRLDAVIAAQGGLRSIEHLSGIVEASSANSSVLRNAHDDFTNGWVSFLSGWAALDSTRLENTARRLVATEVTIVPTLVHQQAYERLRDGSSRVLGLTPEIVNDLNPPNHFRQSSITTAVIRELRRGFPRQQLFVRRFKANGGFVAAGSGTPSPYLLPGKSLHDELALLVAAGFTPEEALLAATMEGARLLQADSIGVIQSGAVADFLILDQNPLSDIANIATINRVVFKGIAYSPNDLR